LAIKAIDPPIPNPMIKYILPPSFVCIISVSEKLYKEEIE